jgi:hypothetical protein
LLEIEGLRIFGTAKEKTSVISFNIEEFILWYWYDNWQIRNSGSHRSPLCSTYYDLL